MFTDIAHAIFKDVIDKYHIINTVDQPFKNTYSNNEQTIRTLFKIGSDKIVLSSNFEAVHSALIAGMRERFFRQNEIKEKVKRILRLKYHAGLSEQKIISENHIAYKLDNPNLSKINYQVYTKAAKIHDKTNKLIPFKDLESTNFASLSLGFTDIKAFQETLEKYAPFVHYMIPGMALDPYELNNLSEQLVHFENVIIGLHTTGYVELDEAMLNFLKQLNEHTKVVLVFLGIKEILAQL